MKVVGWVLLGLVFLAGIIVVATWNSLNTKNQAVLGGKSLCSSALANCTEKIKMVWTANQQQFEFEKETLRVVTEARNSFEAAMKAFNDAAAKSGETDTQKLTQLADAAYRSALAVNVQIEAYPELHSSEITKENARNMEASVDQVKAAFDDWIVAIQRYNTTRGGFFTTIVASLFSGRFPESYAYYEGPVNELNTDLLNPQAAGGTK
ncbi:MAG: LemA family protein [Candidatus Paceibacterota bacterium]|jgi:hypothetical protein